MSDTFSNDKILCHMEELDQYLKMGHTGHPITVEIDLTNKCNNKCPKCTGQTKNASEMDFKLFKKIIDNLEIVGVKSIVLTGGGEPLIYSKIIDAINYIHNANIEVGLITSGQSLDMSYKFLDKLIRYLSWIRVSVDAGTPKHYKDTHGLDSKHFSRVIAFVDKICRIKDLNRYKVDIGIGYLVCLWEPEEEIKDIDKFVRLFSNRNLSYIQLRPYHDSEHRIDYDKTTLDYIAKYYPHTKLYNTSMTRYEPRTYKKCHGSRFTTVICADGKVYYCCLSRNNSRRMIGDLNFETFEEIWDREMLESVDKNIDVNKCPPQCKNHVINNRIESMINLSKDKHRNFL